MNLLEKNCILLENSRHIIEPLDNHNIKFSTDKKNEDALFSYYLNNELYKFSRNDELNILKDVNFKKDGIFFVFGIGMASHLFELESKVTNNSRIIVIENNKELFLQTIENIDLEPLIHSEKIQFIVADEETWFHYLDNVLKSSVVFLVNSLQFIIHPYYTNMYNSETILHLQRLTLRIIKTRLFEMGNDVEDTIRGLRQNFYNLQDVLDSPGCKEIRQLGYYKNKPAIIVSAGPSLNKQLKKLEKAKGKALILCVDTALKVLLENSIIPDAVLSVERDEVVFNYFYKRYEIPDSVTLIAPPVVYPEIYRKVRNKIICFKEGEALNHWLNELVGDKGMFKMGTSVAHLAFGFANYIKCSPIIFIGQDLAYGSDDNSHFEGSIYEVETYNSIEEEAYLDGYYGNKVKSTVTWEYFLNWFESEIVESDSECINSTEGGVKIKGTIQMSFEDALNDYVLNSSVQPLNRVLDKINNTQEKDQQQDVIKALKAICRSFQKISLLK